MNIQNWTFFYPGFEPLSCTAPCTMLSVLYENGTYTTLDAEAIREKMEPILNRLFNA